jgi:hypothetical protein
MRALTCLVSTLLGVLRMRAAGFPRSIQWVDHAASHSAHTNATRPGSRPDGSMVATICILCLHRPQTTWCAKRMPSPPCFPRNGETLESANPFLAELEQLPRRIRTEELSYFC